MKKHIYKMGNTEIVVIIDPGMNKYKDVIICPDKLEKANEILEKAGDPEEVFKKLEEAAKNDRPKK